MYEPALRLVADVLEASGELLAELGEDGALEVREAAAGWAKRLRWGDRLGEDGVREMDRNPFDWDGARRFVFDIRDREHRHAIRTVGDLRSTLQTVLTRVVQSVTREQTADQELAKSVNRLSDALDCDSVQELRRRASEAVSVVGEILEQRSRRQDEHMRTLNAQLTALRDELDSAKRQVAVDPLTGLVNRRAFDARLRQTGRWGQTLGTAECIMMVDVDHFKLVNDTYGHLVGDSVLAALARCLRESFRGRDDLVARFGGEEFAVVVFVREREIAFDLAQRVLRAVRGLRVDHEGKQITVTVSIGLAIRHDGESTEEWIRRADRALYSAKDAGRDRCIAV
jgi:diguanylate cyclase (GGDEF)-like protein